MPVFVGDIHGDTMAMCSLLNRLEVRGRTVVQVGDFGIGFHGDPISEGRALQFPNNSMIAGGNVLLVVRGNHDDPRYFDGTVGGKSYVRFLADYTVQLVEGRKVLFVGGAISIDRKARKEGVSWWPGEGFRYDPAALERLDLSDLYAVVTHTAPDFAPPVAFDDLVRAYLKGDPKLERELRAERAAVASLYKRLARSRHAPRYWVYGHFHAHHELEYRGTHFVGLDVCEAWMPEEWGEKR
jgi:predicted phosphodiesterase